MSATLHQEELTLEHPEVRFVRDKFIREVNSDRSKCKLSFEELLDYFKSNKKSRTEIGDIAGISRERVRQIYNKYFKDLFGNKEAVDFQRDRTKSKRSEKALQGAYFLGLIEATRELGLKIFPILKGKSRHLKSQLIINSYKCLLMQPLKPRKPTSYSRSYYLVTSLSIASLYEVDVVIFYIKAGVFPELIFIVPSKILIKTYFDSHDKNGVTVYLPTEKKPVYRNRRPKLDWWKYENNWDFFKKTN